MGSRIAGPGTTKVTDLDDDEYIAMDDNSSERLAVAIGVLKDHIKNLPSNTILVGDSDSFKEIKITGSEFPAVGQFKGQTFTLIDNTYASEDITDGIYYWDSSRWIQN